MSNSASSKGEPGNGIAPVPDERALRENRSFIGYYIGTVLAPRVTFEALMMDDYGAGRQSSSVLLPFRYSWPYPWSSTGESARIVRVPASVPGARRRDDLHFQLRRVDILLAWRDADRARGGVRQRREVKLDVASLVAIIHGLLVEIDRIAAQEGHHQRRPERLRCQQIKRHLRGWET